MIKGLCPLGVKKNTNSQRPQRLCGEKRRKTHRRVAENAEGKIFIVCLERRQTIKLLCLWSKGLKYPARDEPFCFAASPAKQKLLILSALSASAVKIA